MQSQSDVLIVGGGVIGLTTAYFLAREGVRVRALDQSTPGSEASWAGAGIIPPGNPDLAATSYDRLRAISSRAFRQFSAELLERTGIDNGYRVCGGIDVFETMNDPTLELWRAEGIEFVPLDFERQRELEPQARLQGAAAYWLPEMAQVRNPWHLRALVAACGSAGVAIEQGRGVTQFLTTGDKVEGAIGEDGTTFQADRVLIAAGAWSEKLLQLLGAKAGVHPVKGQIVLFRSPQPLIQRILSFDKRYLVPRKDGRILAGSTEEPEAGFDKRSTESGVQELIRFAVSVVPRLAEVEIEKTWAGLRPGSPDGMPYLGRIGLWRNAFVATGHYRAGIQLSLSTAMATADLLQGRPPMIPLDDFCIDRPRTSPVVPAFRS